MYLEKVCALRTEISNTIENIAKRELGTDMYLIVFDNSVYFYNETTNVDLTVDGITLSKDGSEVILLQEGEKLCMLCDVCLDMLAEIADVLKRGAYEVDEW
jgi:hypothetical protein